MSETHNSRGHTQVGSGAFTSFPLVLMAHRQDTKLQRLGNLTQDHHTLGFLGAGPQRDARKGIVLELRIYKHDVCLSI